MTFVFISNYFNHHQKPLADAIFAKLGDGYHFIETEPMSEERKNMGWGMNQKPSYVLQSYTGAEQLQQCQQLLLEADVVMWGSAPYNMIVPRLKAGKLTLGYSERLYKAGCPYHKLPWHFGLYTKKFRRYKNFYLLCASAYTAADFAKTFCFLNKTYKWGYFPDVKEYADIDALIESKKPASILWAGRIMDWKHPEYAVEVAKRLHNDGIDFTLNIIGNGQMDAAIQEMVEKEGLSQYVKLLGSMKPEQVREHMEQSEIYLFTSDRGEGWGAVLNESMNSACAVVACSAIGAAPFLLQDGENGRMYKSGDVDGLYRHVKDLLANTNERKRLSRNAYTTLTQEWNPKNAANKLLHLCERLLSGEKRPFPYPTGVCSKAEVLKDE